MDSPLFVFGEGITEQVVFRKLAEFLNQSGQLSRPIITAGTPRPDLIAVGGKNNFKQVILDTVGLRTKALSERGVRLLVFRDRDQNEKEAALKQSFVDIVRSLVDQSQTNNSWKPHAEFTNISSLEITNREAQANSPLRLVLHLATNPLGERPSAMPDFNDKTTDGYILQLALSSGVIGRFAPKDVKVGTHLLSQKITQEIPELFQQNGLPFDTDKDYLAAYLLTTRFWKTRRTEDKARLVEIILDRAVQHEPEAYQTAWASWIAAIKEVQQ